MAIVQLSDENTVNNILFDATPVYRQDDQKKYRRKTDHPCFEFKCLLPSIVSKNEILQSLPC